MTPASHFPSAARRAPWRWLRFKLWLADQRPFRFATVRRMQEESAKEHGQNLDRAIGLYAQKLAEVSQQTIEQAKRADELIASQATVIALANSELRDAHAKLNLIDARCEELLRNRSDDVATGRARHAALVRALEAAPVAPFGELVIALRNLRGAGSTASLGDIQERLVAIQARLFERATTKRLTKAKKKGTRKR